MRIHLCLLITAITTTIDPTCSICANENFLHIFIKSPKSFPWKEKRNLMRASVIIRIFRLAVEYDRNPTPVPRFFGHFFLFNIFSLSVLFIFSSPDASIEILLACSFEWFEVLKRHSITRHFRDPEEDDAIAEENGKRRRRWRQWRKRGENFSCRRTVDRIARHESSGEFWWIICRGGSQSISENLSWLHSPLTSTVT